jgi:hypothetical protein
LADRRSSLRGCGLQMNSDDVRGNFLQHGITNK